MAIERVVITGLGAVTPLGLNVRDTWAAMLEGRSGIHEIKPVHERSKVRYFGHVQGFDPKDFLDPKIVQRTQRSSQLALVVGGEALADAEALKNGKINRNFDPFRSGVYVGTGAADTLFSLEADERRKRSYKIGADAVEFGMERPPGIVAKSFGLQGQSCAMAAACASSGEAAGMAVSKIENGEADLILVVGVEAVTELKDGTIRYPVAVSGYESLRALSTKERDNASEASQPFSPNRDGFVMSEGAAALVLESEQHALKRGAQIRSRILGTCETNDAYHDTAPSGIGAFEAIKRAMKRARISRSDVDYINPHATSTPIGDDIERAIMTAVFGEELQRIAINPSKSIFGHMLGAAGAVEALITSLVLETGICPPALNQDRLTDLSDELIEMFSIPKRLKGMQLYIPTRAVAGDFNVGLSNSFGFGGHNTVLVLGKYQ